MDKFTNASVRKMSKKTHLLPLRLKNAAYMKESSLTSHLHFSGDRPEMEQDEGGRNMTQEFTRGILVIGMLYTALTTITMVSSLL